MKKSSRPTDMSTGTRGGRAEGRRRMTRPEVSRGPRREPALPEPALPAGAAHRVAHLGDARGEPDEDRAAHERVADVQLLHLRNGGDGADVAYRQPVTGVDGEPELGAAA